MLKQLFEHGSYSLLLDSYTYCTKKNKSIRLVSFLLMSLNIVLCTERKTYINLERNEFRKFIHSLMNLENQSMNTGMNKLIAAFLNHYFIQKYLS